MKNFTKIAAVNVNAKKVRRVVVPAIDNPESVKEIYAEAARYGWKIVVETSDRGYSAMIDEIEKALRA